MTSHNMSRVSSPADSPVRRAASFAVRWASAFALGSVLCQPLLAGAGQAVTETSASAKRADLQGELASGEVQHIADWAIHSGDHQRLPFIIVDKANAKAFAFNRSGKLIRSTPVLIGMGVGDTFPPGVIDLDMYHTKPWQRITPAGRYFAEEDLNLEGERVLWVDYDAAIAIHKLPTKRTKQRRHERIKSADPAEHRITYGCINVPAAFYDQIVHPQFRDKGGIVYVLPDVKPLKAVFRSYDVADPAPYTREQHNPRQVLPAAVHRF